MKRSAQGRRGIRYAIFAGLAVVVLSAAMGAAGAAGRGAKCGTLDGKYENGSWLGGVAAPGITVLSASDEEITFTVADGMTLKGLCVKTGSTTGNYDIDATLPVYGPGTVTVSKSGPGTGLGSISFDTEVTPPCTAQAPDVTFGEPLFIDRTRAGGEPVTTVAQDGSINVSAHAGTTHIYKTSDSLPGARDFLWGYTNQTLNWRSTDGGLTWRYTGLAGDDEGPHSLLSTGFSDPDYAMDQAGNLYNVEIDLANDAVYKSTDDGQSWPIAVPLAAPGDRPWLTALEPNEVFLYVNNFPKSMQRSTDPNLLVWERLPTPRVTSKSMPDPLNPNNGMIGPVDLGQFAVTGDDAHTWKTFRFGPPGAGGGRNILGKATQFFGVVGVDNAGNVYQAAAGGYNGGADDGQDDTVLTGNDGVPTAQELHDGQVTFTYYERNMDRTGGAEPDRTNQQKITIPTPDGDALWPWVIAGDDGRVAVVWYQRLASEPEHFYIFVAVTKNATGRVACANGSTKFEPPKWTVLNVSQRPVHVGKICLDGTACNADPNPVAGDRRLGDFFTVNYDLNGDLIIASGDTTLPGSLRDLGIDVEGKKPVGNPIFIRQTSGDRMLEEPIQPRETRPLSGQLPIEP